MPTMRDRRHGLFEPGAKGSYTIASREYYLGTTSGSDIVGRKFDVASYFISFDSVQDHTEFDAAVADNKDLAIAWQPSRTVGLTFADILAGVYDTHINNWLNYFGALRKPDGTTKPTVAVRFGHEMNGSFMAWNPLFSQTATNSSHCTSAAQFVQVWQYMVGKQQAHAAANAGGNGATNVKWWFCPNQNDSSGGPSLESMYPGSAYVDIIGYDSYNGLNGVYMTPTQTLQGFTNGAQSPTYDRVTALHATAEVWIGETGCVDLNDPKDAAHLATGHDKGVWFDQLFALDSTVLPRLTTICWFDNPAGTRNWAIDTSTSALNRWKADFPVGHTVVIPNPATPGQVPVWTGYSPPYPEPHDSSRNHPAEHSSFKHFLNQILNLVGGWTALEANTDGTDAALQVTANAVGTTSKAAVRVDTPGTTKRALSVFRNLVEMFTVDNDGKLQWGKGDGTFDVTLARSGTATATLTGGLTVTGAVSAGTMAVSQMPVTGSATPTKPAVGSGAVLFGIADTVKVQTPDLLLAFQQSPADIHKMWLSMDPAIAASTYLPPQGTLWLAKMAITEAVTLTQIGVNVTTAGATLTTGTSCLGVVFDTSGNLLGTTADQATAWQSTGEKRATLTAVGSLTVKPGYVYAGVMASGTTNPTFSAAVGGPLNWNLAASQGRALTNSSALTAAPATITIGNSGLSTRLPFVAIK